MTKASDNPFPSILVAEQGSAPATPASGYGRIYCKSDGLYFIGDDGVEVGPLVAGGGGGGGYTQGCKATNTADHAISATSWTLLNFNSELWDTDAIHDNSTNPSRFTCKTAGKYLVFFHGMVNLAINTKYQIDIFVNNVSVESNGMIPGNNGYQDISVNTILDLAQDDYVEFKAYFGNSTTIYGSWGSGNYNGGIQRIG
jgi:hypothetical protein